MDFRRCPLSQNELFDEVRLWSLPESISSTWRRDTEGENRITWVRGHEGSLAMRIWLTVLSSTVEPVPLLDRWVGNVPVVHSIEYC